MIYPIKVESLRIIYLVFEIFLALLLMMVTKNVPESLSVSLGIHKSSKDFFLAYRVVCVKLSQQVNVASFFQRFHL